MEEKSIEEVVANLLNARSDALSASMPSLPQGTGGTLHLGKTGGYSVGMKGIRALNAATDLLVSDKIIGSNFSREALRKEIDDIFPTIITLPPQQVMSQTRSLVDALVQELETTPVSEWTVIIPIDGLQLKGRAFKIGLVTFINFQSLRTSTELKAIYSALTKPRLGTTLQALSGKVIVAVKVKAVDGIQAEIKGVKQAERALDILRFYFRALSPNNPILYKMYMGLKGTTFVGRSHIISIDSSGGISTSSAAKGALFPYVIDSAFRKAIRKTSFRRIDQIVKKDENEQTPFEKLLLVSMHLFGSGMNEIQDSNRFINFIIALESLVLREKEPIKGLLAERIALILTKQARSRLFYFQQMTRLYQLRSDLVHRGINGITEADVNQISAYAFVVLDKLMKSSNRINDIGKLVEKLKEIKFGGPAFKI
jgi:hypothetical protein